MVVNFYDSNGRFKAHTLSETDGYFNFLGLTPGRYTVRLDTAQLRLLHLTSSPDSLSFVMASSEEGAIADGFEFMLQYLPGFDPDSADQKASSLPRPFKDFLARSQPSSVEPGDASQNALDYRIPESSLHRNTSAKQRILKHPADVLLPKVKAANPVQRRQVRIASQRKVGIKPVGSERHPSIRTSKPLPGTLNRGQLLGEQQRLTGKDQQVLERLKYLLKKQQELIRTQKELLRQIKQLKLQLLERNIKQGRVRK
jgi:hypothetical protein